MSRTNTSRRMPPTSPNGERLSSQRRPWLLPNLLDRHLLDLKWTENRVADDSLYIYRHRLDRAAEDLAQSYQRRAELVDDPAHPRTWHTGFGLLLGIHGPALAAMKRRARATGAPPAQYEYVVSCQIMEALMRGHMLAASNYLDDDQDDDDQDELVHA